MRPTSWKVLGELAVGLGALVAAMFAVAVIVWIDIDDIQAANIADSEAHEELAQVAAATDAMVDHESALRRFLLTGDPQFLQSYEASGRQFDAAMRRLTVLVADDPPDLRRAAADITRQARTWTDTVATPAIAAALAGRRDPRGALAGRPLMDAIRGDIAVLRGDETQLLAKRDAVQAQTFRSSRITLIFGSGLALVFALLIGGRSSLRLIGGRRAAEAAAAKLAEALERAHAAERAKTLFLSNMSHEMRTPLNGVAGMAEALGRMDLGPGQRELVGVIRRSAASLDGLIADLLTLSGGGKAEERAQDRAPFHLGDSVRAIAAVHRAAAEMKRLQLDADVAPEAEIRVIGDAARLEQLLACLLSNAVKFTDRGEVRLRLARLAAHRYRFEVTDTGIGFDEARKAELFETFSQSDASTTRRHGGAGLGLALARQFAADLGGQLDCRSGLGEGSVFTFDIDLPTADADRAENGGPVSQGAGEAAEPAGQAPLRILVVDDNATNRRVLELILEQLGIEWVSAEDGQQAVAAAHRQDFAAILMDIQMPVMDGLTATREIRRLEQAAERPATPVIIVSANGQPEHIHAGRAAGAQRHLTKPVSVQALLDALNAVLAAPSTDGPVWSEDDHETGDMVVPFRRRA
jgi:signal transduction histidine kinase/ActR/RegA family two-component response regulator